MDSTAVEKTEEELPQEVDELLPQQRQITERLRSPPGFQSGGLSAAGPRNFAANVARQGGIVRPFQADGNEAEDQPPGKRRLLSPVVKVEDGEIIENDASKEQLVEEENIGMGKDFDKRPFNIQQGDWSRRDGIQREVRKESETLLIKHMPRVFPKNEGPSLVSINKRMREQLLGTLEMDKRNHSIEGSNLVPDNIPMESSNLVPDNISSEETIQVEGTGSSSLRSDVWYHFNKIKLNDRIEKAECKYCHKMLVGSSKVGTSHLKRHVESCNKRKMRGQTFFTPNLMKGKSEMTVTSYDYNRSKYLLTKMIIDDEQPLSIVDNQNFRMLLTSLQPTFKVPTRNVVKKDILKIYEDQKNLILKTLSSIHGRVAITSDMWMIDDQKNSYMAVTGHYIDNDWILCSRLLSFIHVPEPHTSERLTTILAKYLMDWNIDTKLSTITLDNCNTNEVMIEKLKNKLPVERLLMDGRLFRMRCFEHIVNLMVKDGFELIKEEVEAIRNSVVYWSETPERVENFEETARQLRIPCTKKLILDCPTKWNSTFKMLESATKYIEVFIRLRQRYSQYTCFPTQEQWELVKAICAKFAIFHDITELFSGTKYPTSHICFSHMCEIKQALSDWIFDSNEVIQIMAEQMMEKFNAYWSAVSYIMAAISVLDPRCKMEGLQFFYQKLYGRRIEAHIDIIKQLWYDLFNDYQLRRDKYHDCGSSVSTSSSSIINTTYESLISQFQEFIKEKKDRTSYNRTELDKYLEADIVTSINNGQFDILSWWKSYGGDYPIMQAIARDLLAIPVSTFTLESTFNIGSRIVSTHYSRLHPKTVEALMCTRSWLGTENIQDAGTKTILSNESFFEQIFDDEGD